MMRFKVDTFYKDAARSPLIGDEFVELFREETIPSGFELRVIRGVLWDEANYKTKSETFATLEELDKVFRQRVDEISREGFKRVDFPFVSEKPPA